MRRTIVLIAVCSLSIVGLQASTSLAQARAVGPRVGARALPPNLANGFLFGGLRSRTSLYDRAYIPVPPYFALHPPVYYSLPAPRSYGNSPFAWFDDYRPRLRRPAPLVVANPHVTPVGGDAAPAADQTAQAPLRILNPYYSPSRPERLANDN